VKKIVDDDRAPRVEFEISLAAGKGSDIVLADHLGADHDHRFLLGRVNLARHDRRAWLVFRQQQLTETATRTRGSQRISLAIFISATASPRTAAIAATLAPSEPCAANLLGAVTNG
jgi:hypothetical protein